MQFRELETERMHLKNIASDDVDFILSQFSDDDVNQYLFDEEPMTEISEAEELVEFYTAPEPRLQHRWILVRKCDGRKIGTCGVHCWNQEEGTIEIGWDMKKEFWGNGYMQEAAKAIIDFVITKFDINRMDACIYIENARSIALAKRLGFEYFGKKRKYIFREREYQHYIYSLLTYTNEKGNKDK